MENILILLIAAGIHLVNDVNKATRYTLDMEDGSKKQLMLKNDNKYACPIYCEADHIHHAIVCKDAIEIGHNKSVYHILKVNQDDIGLFCSYMKILSMKKWKFKKPSSDELPDVVSASR